MAGLTLTTGKTTDVELHAGKYVRWNDVSRHPNSKATKPWTQVITGTHEKYGVDGEWLNKTTIDGSTCFDVSDLTPGDYIKVSGASHNNKKHAYYRVESLNGELEITRVKESAVIEAMEQPDELDALRQDVMAAVQDCDDRTTLESVREVLSE